MTETLARLLLRLSEAGNPAILWGRQAKPYLGREFDRLLDHALLVEQAPADEWDVCTDCECGLDQRPIQRIDGILVAACPFDHAKDVRIEPEDVRSFKIDCGALIQEIARESGFENPSEVAPGVWHLGDIAGLRTVFITLSRHTVRHAGLIGLLQRANRSGQVSLVTPLPSPAEGLPFSDAGILLVPIEECVGDEGTPGLWAIDKGKLGPLTTIGLRLVINRSSQSAIIDGREKAIPQQPFKLLLAFAEAAKARKRSLTTQQIESANSGRSTADLVRELRGALSIDPKSPKEGKALIQVRRSPTAYFLALAADEFEVRP